MHFKDIHINTPFRDKDDHWAVTILVLENILDLESTQKYKCSDFMATNENTAVMQCITRGLLPSTH